MTNPAFEGFSSYTTPGDTTSHADAVADKATATRPKLFL